MNVSHPSPRQLSPWHFLTRGLAGLFIAFLLVWIARPAHAAPPPAGTSISNQASATYSDASGMPRTVTSNLVQTTVTQVYSLTLSAPGAQNATPGSVVYYPHTLTNTGNGTDTFNLAAVSAATAFTMTSVQIFADNGSGQPTGAAITSSGPVASGSSFKFIVTGTVPATATSAQSNVVTATATSLGDGTKTASNADTTTVTSNAVVTLTKSISVASGAPGSGPFTYKLTYTNTGNSDATALAISDIVPSGMTYVAGSARWSVTGVTGLSDAGGSVGTSPNTLTSTYTSASKTFVATLAKVAAGQSGYITFDVTVGGGTAPGTLNNTATTSYNNGVATVTGFSNTVPFTVTQTANVSLTGATLPGPAAPGTTVSFTNVVTNTGNGTDTFNITFAATNTFPAGTTFQLYKSDGNTPLVDTNGDGTVDTGPLAAGTSYNVIVKATLPPSASSTGPFSIDKTATSFLDATKKATATDTLTLITLANVDLANTSGATGAGIGIGPEAAAQVTKTTNPGTATVITLVVKNTGNSPDTYNMAASTASTFSSVTLPAGWTVDFKADGGAGTCASTGATITNTGNVAANGFVTICAVVTVPAGYTAGTTDLYFRSLSPTSTAVDALHDAVTVNAVRSLSITPNGAGQTYPGGSYVYTHTLTNNGNVAEGGALSTLTPTEGNSGAGWTSTFYVDSNGNGVLDAGDTLISGSLNAALGAGGLPQGGSITVFNKVIAPSGASAGTINVTTITVNTVNGTYVTTAPAPAVATDSTTVIAGNLTLIKLQAPDADCDGNVDATFAYGQGNLNAKPGACVLYQITVTNVGAADATNVVVSDATPSYTTVSTAAATASPGKITGPALGAAGTITAYIGTGATTPAGGTLAAGQSAVITFGVKITP
jgi:uncharacterized repeat protein (TIGR01451 family)